jgi:nucleoid-associated protein YgaU
LDRYNDPIYAIYHLREYLLQADDGQEVAVVKQLIDTAKKKFIRSLPGNNYTLDAHAEFIEISRRLREENVALKLALREAETRCRLLESRMEGGTRVLSMKSCNPVQTHRIHVVQAGDTLSKISQKYYGTPVHWKKIFEANRGEIPFPNALTVEQRLIIP